jgi:hypothetical protein
MREALAACGWAGELAQDLPNASETINITQSV